jgi:hypothetical protein
MSRSVSRTTRIGVVPSGPIDPFARDHQENEMPARKTKGEAAADPEPRFV